ncbi:MAG: hypothetical protein ACR2G5_12480 [Pyrinomonadaceae bacterium]
MERAFQFAGYEVQHVWGDGGHTEKHASAVFPDAMRWLWHDCPKPVTAGQSKNATLANILIPGEGWQLVGEGYKSTEEHSRDEAAVLLAARCGHFRLEQRRRSARGSRRPALRRQSDGSSGL